LLEDASRFAEKQRLSPTVSFVIVTWNGKHLLEECLPFIEQQDFQDHEIIVVDNGSTDGTREFLKADFPRVRVLELSENQGFAAPNNFGFRNSGGQYIATVNNDMTLDRQWLRQLVTALELHPNCFAAQGKILKASEPGIIDTCGLGIRPCGAARNRSHNQPENSALSETVPIFTVSAGAALYRTAKLRELNYFDPTYFAYYEDLDLGWRARLKGWNCLLVPEAKAFHKVHGTSSSVPGDFLWFMSERNRLRTLLKNLPAKAFLRHPLQIAMDELRYIDMIRKKTGWSTLFRARWEVFKEFFSLLQKRMPELKNFSARDWEEWIRISSIP
jgi:GT2 family glycosyltransferase